MEGPLYAFAASPKADLRVRTDRGRVTGFEGAGVPFAGGLLVRTHDPVTGAPRSPLALLDFTLEIDPSATRRIARFGTPWRSSDRTRPLWSSPTGSTP